MNESLKNISIWTILDEDSYTSDEIEWIEQHIANGGDIDGIYFYDYISCTFNPHFFDQRGKVPEKNGKMIAGIYIAGVVVFLFFLILILHRYGIKCRKNILNKATVEQGDWVCCSKRCSDTEDDDSDCESHSNIVECLCCFGVRNQTEVYNLNELQQIKMESEQEEKEDGQQKSDETEWISVFEKEFQVNFDSNSLRSLDSLYTIEECPSKEDLYY